MAAFSRIQLAAALLEYDNDLTNPSAPYRSAHDSALFIHLGRTAPIPPAITPRRSTDYLGVDLPSENGSSAGRKPPMPTATHKKSASSIHALRNPFGGDVTVEDEEEPERAEGLEVDLASWGLDAFMPEDKAAKQAAKLRQNSAKLPNPHPDIVDPRPSRSSRSMSMGNFGGGGAFLDAQSSATHRPHSVADPLDQSEMQPPQAPFQRRRASSHALIETLPIAAPLHIVPFTSSDSRSGSPMPDDSERPVRRPASRGSVDLLDTERIPHVKSDSSNGRALLDDPQDSMFAVRPPSPKHASRFDPKSNHLRTTSNASMGTTAQLMANDDSMFAVKPPPPSRSSKFDPKMAAHARTISNTSLGSRVLLEQDAVSHAGGASMRSGRPSQTQTRPYSAIELLRPKVLIMPTPLQNIQDVSTARPTNLRDGFQLSTDGPPLPPGAKSSRLSGAYDPSPVTSHMFTPNPRFSLSLSQLAFRNTLLVGGERDVAYSDIDRTLPRATEEGEQMHIVIEEAEDEAPLQFVPAPEPSPPGRPAGKLFGKSLIDDLEQRKASMRSKQRHVGDDRPSMMARGSLQRSSTLIDPESLQRPVSGFLDTVGSQAPLTRKNSVNAKPLLTFDDSLPGARTTLIANPRAQMGRSVFGTDTLWEREMAKLKEMEAQEKLEKDMQEQEAEEALRLKGKKKKGKGKAKDTFDPGVSVSIPDLTTESLPRVSAEPPRLPNIKKTAIRGQPPVVNDDESESDSDNDDRQAPVQRADRNKKADAAIDHWIAESDEEDGPMRVPGVGPRYPASTQGRSQHDVDEDSDEDLPLAATLSRAVRRARSQEGDESDEDKPLAAILDKAKLSLPSVNFDNLAPRGLQNEDDDQPLGLRASRMLSSNQTLGSYADEDEDDKPLAFHPDQQRRTQYQALAQQQQMMMQAQMQQSMFFGTPSTMGSGYFGPPMTPMMMRPQMFPQQFPSPAPSQEGNKFGRVDRWRRDVAVEGPPP